MTCQICVYSIRSDYGITSDHQRVPPAVSAWRSVGDADRGRGVGREALQARSGGGLPLSLRLRSGGNTRSANANKVQWVLRLPASRSWDDAKGLARAPAREDLAAYDRSLRQPAQQVIPKLWCAGNICGAAMDRRRGWTDRLGVSRGGHGAAPRRAYYRARGHERQLWPGELHLGRPCRSVPQSARCESLGVQRANQNYSGMVRGYWYALFHTDVSVEKRVEHGARSIRASEAPSPEIAAKRLLL